MAKNHYQWTSERAITAVAPSPSKKQASMYEVSALDHLNAKVDALFQKFDKLTISAVTPALVLSPCQNNQIFYNKTPQNLFGQQTTPPGFTNNQRGPQKSNLELLLIFFCIGSN